MNDNSINESEDLSDKYYLLHWLHGKLDFLLYIPFLFDRDVVHDDSFGQII